MRKLLTPWIALAAIALASVLAHAFGCRGWPQIAGGNGCNSSIATGGSSCSGWTPATPSGLIGWYNADSANVSPNTMAVTVMADLSSGGHNMAPNGFVGPTYNTTGLWAYSFGDDGGRPSFGRGGFTLIDVRGSTAS
jgi:hypothetical protein